MNLEVFRVDAASRIVVGESWAGFGLDEQRFPVQGEAWQLWGIERLTPQPGARILRGGPMTPPLGTPHALAKFIADSDRAITQPAVGYAAALRFVLDIKVAPNESLVGTRYIMGIAGAVAALEQREARART